MATSKTVWGIDIGQVALKAIKLRSVEGELQVEAFDIIEHTNILSQPDVDRRHLIRNALEQFLARNEIADSTVVVAVPGHQSSFMRFVKLPPVDPKKIPDIVRFEAQQQIPFDINEVQWRYQIFRDPDSPDVEAGIFAVKQVDINDLMERFTEVGMRVDVIQMPVMALYNFMTYDGQLAPDGATLLVDIGADKTDLVVSDGPRMWVRTIQIGGNNFTEALVKALKYPFGKAERLKRTAVSHKYARQIFQAMRPVFSDLAQEIRRSIGAYTATHRETRVRKLVGLGNGFRMPGLQKYLEQDLNIPVVPIDSYNHLMPSASISAPTFTQNVLSFGVAYGLALQGLGETAISTNLLPEKVQEAIKWKRRQWWFAGAAAAILVALALPVAGKYKDNARLAINPNSFASAKAQLESERRESGNVMASITRLSKDQEAIAALSAPLKYRDVWPAIVPLVLNSLRTEQTDVYMAYGEPMTDDALAQVTSDLKSFGQVNGRPDRSARQVFVITEMTSEYQQELGKADARGTQQQQPGYGGPGAGGPMYGPDGSMMYGPGGQMSPQRPPASSARTARASASTATQGPRGFVVKIRGTTPMSENACRNYLLGMGGQIGVKALMQEQAQTILDPTSNKKNKQLLNVVDVELIHLERPQASASSGGVATGGMMTGPAATAAGGARTGPFIRQADPLFADEDSFTDTKFEIRVLVSLMTDEPDAPEPSSGTAAR